MIWYHKMWYDIIEDLPDVCGVQLNNSWVRLDHVVRASCLLCMITVSAWDGMGWVPWRSTVYCGWVAVSTTGGTDGRQRVTQSKLLRATYISLLIRLSYTFIPACVWIALKNYLINLGSLRLFLKSWSKEDRGSAYTKTEGSDCNPLNLVSILDFGSSIWPEYR